jgi:prevent-host-death family protein
MFGTKLIRAENSMKLSQTVKPISYLKNRTAEAVRCAAENRCPLVITQHGEAKAVLQGIRDYEQTQETLALLKMLAQSAASRRAGRQKPVRKTFSGIRSRVRGKGV